MLTVPEKNINSPLLRNFFFSIDELAPFTMVSSKYFFRLGRLFILSQLYIAGLGVDAQGHETHSHGHKHLSHGRLHKSKTLAARDDYSCSASNPCSNGACCGAGGYCGYGSTYCGDGCLSNCDATAECGQYAATKNATCPLNVWYVIKSLPL